MLIWMIWIDNWMNQLNAIWFRKRSIFAHWILKLIDLVQLSIIQREDDSEVGRAFAMSWFWIKYERQQIPKLVYCITNA